MTEIKGYHVLGMFGLGFGVIIAVNLTLAFQAVRTFPGLEVKNSYVASQSFDDDRAAQQALGWDVAAWLEDGALHLQILDDGVAIDPVIEKAVFGRATSVAADQEPAFIFDGASLVAPVVAGDGNWNLRVQARADDGTHFAQRIIVAKAP